MRILDDQSLNVIWHWGEIEHSELANRFRANLLRLLAVMKERLRTPGNLNREDVAQLSQELTDAGTLLDICASNCLAMAATLHHLNGDDDAATAVPTSRLEAAVGKPVVLTHTTLKELQGEGFVLDSIEEDGVLVRRGDDLWKTPVDRILVLDESDIDLGTASE